jgi:hypothetical protein
MYRTSKEHLQLNCSFPHFFSLISDNKSNRVNAVELMFQLFVSQFITGFNSPRLSHSFYVFICQLNE